VSLRVGKHPLPAALGNDAGARTLSERGFSLIELLIVIVIIGILAGIGIPLLINQKDKANDSGAKVMARSAETAMEAYATQNNGSYAGASVSALHSIEPALVTSSTTQAYLASVSVTGSTSYVVVASSPVTSEDFSITKSANTVTRTCSGSGGGCAGGTW
jgi:type IV pilus assembly protein PilA